jgi:hypothetical protein
MHFLKTTDRFANVTPLPPFEFLQVAAVHKKIKTTSPFLSNFFKLDRILAVCAPVFTKFIAKRFFQIIKFKKENEKKKRK